MSLVLRGRAWKFGDDINTDLCIAQLEFIDQHPASDAVVIGGTQDNGTEQFRNSGVFNHAADGDGGAAMIDQSNPRNVIQFRNDLRRTARRSNIRCVP